MRLDKVGDFFSKYKKEIFKKDTIIIYPDTNLRSIYYLQKGYVRAYAVSDEGIELTLNIYSPGAYFPLKCAFQNAPTHYYFEAITPVTVYVAPTNDVLSFISHEPEILLDLTKRLFTGIDKLTLRIEHLVFDSAYKRVISSLKFLASHFGDHQSDTVQLKQKFTHRDIASIAGVSRETASREFEKLEKIGFISYKNQNITIHSMKKLDEELSR